jgi:hypothetical protein
MNALAIGGIVFGCVFGGAMFGMFLRAVLPEHHLSTESKDVIKLAIAMIATLAALVIGLLIASAKSSFDGKATEITRLATDAILLDRTLAEYGPETREIRDASRQLIAARLREIWPDEGTRCGLSDRPNGSALQRAHQNLQRSRANRLGASRPRVRTFVTGV